jgi:mannose-6-phosphate isomerase-like protein (cupin superfamily)
MGNPLMYFPYRKTHHLTDLDNRPLALIGVHNGKRLRETDNAKLEDKFEEA